jgi:hypothetical protein
LSSSLTSMYLWVVAMLLCPARLANTRTVTPLLASRVINVLRPEWLEAPSMPAPL